ncbi:thiamine pyrophosphate-binding protein [Balneolaceae bacterium ANBcel3]|nr:thiamine pyrophosphate-binding protein [Balneolaceae bacterium ANBcel3]
MDVNQAIVDIIEQAGIDHVFGGSGQINATMLLALRDSPQIKTIITRNEQAASFMACGYAMFSDKPGVCFATGGPGAFNLFSGLAVAYSDSLPVVSVTGYTSANQRGKGALNESTGRNRTPDSHAMFSATTKKSYILEDPADTYDLFEEAINIALEGRPGPVNVHIPKDVAMFEVPEKRKVSINVQPVLPQKNALEQAASLIASALENEKKLLFVFGYGCIRSGAQSMAQKLVERFNIPFAHTMDGRGFLPEQHPMYVGMYGTSGDPSAIARFNESDMIIAVGNSFAQNATYAFKTDLLMGKQLVHINIDPVEIDKVYKADVGITGDAAPALEALYFLLDDKNPAIPVPRLAKEMFYDSSPQSSSGKIHPGEMVKILSDHLPPNAIVLGDAGSHMLWLSGYLNLNTNQRYQNPGSFGPMASHTNGAIGVKCAHPDKMVIAGSGDGCYLMSGFELLTAVQYQIPVTWIIFNNGEYNVIKKFLVDHFDDEAFMKFNNPDYVKYAEACGAEGYKVTRIEEFGPALRKAMERNRPCLIDVHVDSEVYPPFNLGRV